MTRNVFTDKTSQFGFNSVHTHQRHHTSLSPAMFRFHLASSIISPMRSSSTPSSPSKSICMRSQSLLSSSCHNNSLSIWWKQAAALKRQRRQASFSTNTFSPWSTFSNPNMSISDIYINETVMISMNRRYSRSFSVGSVLSNNPSHHQHANIGANDYSCRHRKRLRMRRIKSNEEMGQDAFISNRGRCGVFVGDGWDMVTEKSRGERRSEHAYNEPSSSSPSCTSINASSRN